MPKLTIDGKEVEFENGMTVLDVAEKANIYIPTLCFIKGLSAHGGCRLCVVKIKGDPKPIQTACSTLAVNGMDIITSDQELNTMRKDIVQLLLSEHPSACLICGNRSVCEDYLSYPNECPSLRISGCFSCPSKLNCQLKKVVEYLGITDLQFPMRYKHLKPTTDDLFFQSDYNLCITCGKCVRICSELMGYHAIELVGRGKNSLVGFPEKVSRNLSECQFCGGCLDVCPVGVYNSNKSHWYKRQETEQKSICGFCSLGCGFQYQIHDNRIIDAIPDTNHQVNRGTACVLGRFCAPEFHHHETRLKTPSIMKNNKQTKVNVDEAIQTISQILSKYRPEQIGIVASPDLTNESAYVLIKFANMILKTSNIGVITERSNDKLTEIDPTLRKSPDTITKSKWIFLIEANIQSNHPVIFPLLKKAKDNGAKINYYSCLDQKVPIQTQYLLNEENYLTTEKLNKIISQIKDSDGSIIIGPDCDPSTIEIINTIGKNNQNISVYPLLSRSNFEGVYSLIQKDAADILNDLNLGKIKVLILTERIDVELAKKAEFIILLDIFPSEITTIAHATLPTRNFLEQQGTYTNFEFKEQNYNSLIPPPSEDCLEDWEIICKIASTMKPELKKEFTYKQSSEIIAERKQNKRENKEFRIHPKTHAQTQLKACPPNLSSAQFRGQPLHQVVRDLSRLVDIRERNKQEQSTIGKREQKQSNLLNIELSKEGSIKIGNRTFGLEALKGIIDIAKSQNKKIQLIINQDLSNSILLKAEELCLCNNYRKNLESSHIMLDLSQKPYTTIISTFIKSTGQDGKENLMYIANPILVDPKFKMLSETKLNSLSPIVIDEIKKPDVGMQYRALKITHFLMKNRKLYLTLPAPPQNKNVTPIKWSIIPGKLRSATTTADGATKLLDPVQGKLVQSDRKKCMGCGHCAEICPHKAITMKDQKEKRGPFESIIVRFSSIDPSVCYRCAKCVSECPVFAISIFNLEKSRI